MQKILSFFVVASLAIPLTFAASGDGVPALVPSPKVTPMNAPSAPMNAPSTPTTRSAVTPSSNGVSLG